MKIHRQKRCDKVQIKLDFLEKTYIILYEVILDNFKVSIKLTKVLTWCIEQVSGIHNHYLLIITYFITTFN